jgi:16S rRNA (guanine527-N7)-methyltransferase
MSLISKRQVLEILENSKLELTGFQFSEEIISRFQEFCALLHKWNDKINLVSEKNPLSILEKHIFDSLQYLRWLDASHKTLDIGSGAGFPGIPVKVMHPDLDITLLESQRKRCNFLREAIRSLQLDGVNVVEGRAEDFSSDEAFSGKFDRVIFRGFSSLSNCLEVGLPFLREKGRIIMKKGPDEMPPSDISSSLTSRIIESKEVEGLGGHRSLMIIVEKCST